VGHVPRCITVHISGDLTRRCNAGDILTISGVFLPEVMTGFRAIRSGLTANTYVEAMDITRQVQSYEESTIDEDATIEIQKIQASSCIAFHLHFF
jgi:DNA replication licensing factor MCM7